MMRSAYVEPVKREASPVSLMARIGSWQGHGPFAPVVGVKLSNHTTRTLDSTKRYTRAVEVPRHFLFQGFNSYASRKKCSRNDDAIVLHGPTDWIFPRRLLSVWCGRPRIASGVRRDDERIS